MNERFLLKLSFMGTLIGIIAIYIIVSQMDYTSVKIGSITGEMIGETINIIGAVRNVYLHEDGHVFLSLSDDTGEMKIVIWSDVAGKLNETTEEGDFVNVIGSVKLYEGELEIIAKDVKVL